MARRRDVQGISCPAALKFGLLLLTLLPLVGQDCGRVMWRNQLPQPLLPDYPSLVELYYHTWEILGTNVRERNAPNGFVHKYINPEEDIFILQAPTTQIALFGIYGAGILPIMNSLENFYRKQRSDGFISRVYNCLTGDYLHSPSTAEPMVNPPLFTWAELRYYYLTGDPNRLRKWRAVWERYFDWLDEQCAATGEAQGLYYTSILGSQMVNSVRPANELGGWVDMSSQMALFAQDLAQIAAICGDSTATQKYRAKYLQIKTVVQTRLWDENSGFFYDIDSQGHLYKTKLISGFWPLIAGLATVEQMEALIGHLQEPREFQRPHLFPSLAANEPEYQRQGAYWRGSVWGDQVFMIVKGLKRYGQYDLSSQAAWNHLINIERVYSHFVPDTALIEKRQRTRITKTIWEAYAPEKEEPATRWDAKYLCRPAYVARSGFGPVAMFLEDVLGFEADAPADVLTWRLWLLNEHGIKNFVFGNNLITIWCEKRESITAPLKIHGYTSSPCTLRLWVGERTHTIQLTRGRIKLTLYPQSWEN